MHYPQIIETIGAFIGRRHELVAAVNAHTPKNAIALRRMLARSAILRRPAGSQSRLAGSSSMGVACQSALGNKILLATSGHRPPFTTGLSRIAKGLRTRCYSPASARAEF